MSARGGGIPFEEINSVALANIRSLLREWFPHGKVKGHEYRVGSINGEAGSSFGVNLTTGKWGEFNGLDPRGGDLISLYAAKFTHGDQGAAARKLAQQFGIETDKQKNGGTEGWFPTIPPPADAGTAPANMLTGFDMVHHYTSLDDRETHFVGRIEARSKKRKLFIPITFGVLTQHGKSVRGWHKKAPAAPCPLYGLNKLTSMPEATVLLLEGEKKADAAQRMYPDYACLAWFGGCPAVDKADLAPLADRKVIGWPDADKPGLAAMAKLLARLPAGTQVVRVDDLPEGFDAWNLEQQKCEDPEAWLKERLQAGTPVIPHELAVVVWRDVRLSDWAGREIPARRWIVPEWIPLLQVSGLYGVSGINKTDFLVQLMMAKSAGLPFMGWELYPAPVYGLFCEDTEEEIVRRAKRIAERYGRDLADFPDFHFASLVGFDMTEFVVFEGAEMIVRPALLRFDQAIMDYHAQLGALDTAPDFFGGSEIIRREVSRFIRKLDGVGMTRDCGVLYTAHPSVRGEISGTLNSGSTGWGAKTRARLSMHDPGEDEDEEQAEERKRLRLPPKRTDRRILIRQQCNYAEAGVSLEFTCRDGFFLPAQIDPAATKTAERGPARNAACDARFLELLGKIAEQGDYVHNSNNVPAHYAPVVFAKRPDGTPFSAAEFDRAMQRLFVAKRLRLERFGKPSDSKVRLVEMQP